MTTDNQNQNVDFCCNILKPLEDQPCKSKILPRSKRQRNGDLKKCPGHADTILVMCYELEVHAEFKSFFILLF